MRKNEKDAKRIYHGSAPVATCAMADHDVDVRMPAVHNARLYDNFCLSPCQEKLHTVLITEINHAALAKKYIKQKHLFILKLVL